MSTADNISLIEIVRSLRKSPIYFLGWFLTLFALVASTYLLLPRKYLSDGRLFVQVGRSSVGTAPTTSSGTVSLQDSRETEVKSVVSMLRSRELAQRVVEKVGAERILKPASFTGAFIDSLPSLSMSGGVSGDSEGELTSKDIDELKLKNRAIKELLKKVEVEHEKKTTVVTIAAALQTPFLARDVINAYLEEYKQKHVEINTRSASGGFFESQFRLHNEELKTAEKELQEFRDSINSLTISGARGLLQREIDQLRLDRASTEIQFAQAKEKASQLAQRLAIVPELIAGAATNMSSLARDKATEALFNLQLEETGLSAKLSNSNPRLIEIRNAIKKAKIDIKEIPVSFSQEEKNVNEAHQQLLVLFSSASAEALSLGKRLEKTDMAIDEKKRDISQMNVAETRGNQLNREIEIRRATVMQMASKRAESATIGALDLEQISNVATAQPASLILKKVFPSGSVFAALGIVFSAFTAALMTFLRETRLLFDPSPEQLRRREGYGEPQSLPVTYEPIIPERESIRATRTVESERVPS